LKDLSKYLSPSNFGRRKTNHDDLMGGTGKGAVKEEGVGDARLLNHLFIL
jgi:hypothetical protein